MKHVILKLKTPNTFQLYWRSEEGIQVPDSQIILDFNPLILEVKRKQPPFFLIHWQARPKGKRQWGIYSSADQNYSSTREIKLLNIKEMKTIQIDEQKIKTVPTAVLFVRGEVLIT